MPLRSPRPAQLVGVALLLLATGCAGGPQARRDQTPVAVERAAAAQPVVPLGAPVTPPRDASEMPHGDLPGWTQVMAEDFTAPALPEGWGAYHGHPGGNQNGWWEESHVGVRDGSLRLAGSFDSTGTYVTGGVMAWAARTTYGKYEVRFRCSKAHGAKYALLLWPSTGSWPVAGEIDFAEDSGGDREATTATLHYGRSNKQVQHTVRADFSTWQTVGVEWTPGRLVYTLGGKPWATFQGDVVPRGPMDLALQLEAGRGDQWIPAPTKSTPASTLEVDWAVAYRRA